MIIACWQIAPALRMGNTVVQKPSEYTTLTGLAIAAVLNEALPPGVLTAVTGPATWATPWSATRASAR